MNSRAANSHDSGRDRAEPPHLLNKATVCQLLGDVTQQHVNILVQSRQMPGPVYLGRMPRWKRNELMTWIDSGCPVLDQSKFQKWKAELQRRRIRNLGK